MDYKNFASSRNMYSSAVIGVELKKNFPKGSQKNGLGNSSHTAMSGTTRETNQGAFLIPEKRVFIIPVQQNLITAMDSDFYVFLIFLFSERETLEQLFYPFSTIRFWVLMGETECLLLYRLPDHKKIYLALIQRSRTLSWMSNLVDFGAYLPYGGNDGVLQMNRSVFMDIWESKILSPTSIYPFFNGDSISHLGLGTWLSRIKTASSLPLCS